MPSKMSDEIRKRLGVDLAQVGVSPATPDVLNTICEVIDERLAKLEKEIVQGEQDAKTAAVFISELRTDINKLGNQTVSSIRGIKTAIRELRNRIAWLEEREAEKEDGDVE